MSKFFQLMMDFQKCKINFDFEDFKNLFINLIGVGFYLYINMLMKVMTNLLSIIKTSKNYCIMIIFMDFPIQTRINFEEFLRRKIFYLEIFEHYLFIYYLNQYSC